MSSLTYLVIGAVIGLITLLIALAHSDDSDRLLKVKQLAIWAAVFIVATILWPIVLFFGFLALMGA
jgi:hypothetical protein